MASDERQNKVRSALWVRGEYCIGASRMTGHHVRNNFLYLNCNYNYLLTLGEVAIAICWRIKNCRAESGYASWGGGCTTTVIVDIHEKLENFFMVYGIKEKICNDKKNSKIIFYSLLFHCHNLCSSDIPEQENS